MLKNFILMFWKKIQFNRTLIMNKFEALNITQNFEMSTELKMHVYYLGHSHLLFSISSWDHRGLFSSTHDQIISYISGSAHDRIGEHGLFWENISWGSSSRYLNDVLFNISFESHSFFLNPQNELIMKVSLFNWMNLLTFIMYEPTLF